MIYVNSVEFKCMSLNIIQMPLCSSEFYYYYFHVNKTKMLIKNKCN